MTSQPDADTPVCNATNPDRPTRVCIERGTHAGHRHTDLDGNRFTTAEAMDELCSLCGRPLVPGCCPTDLTAGWPGDAR